MPRSWNSGRELSDRIFHGTAGGIGLVVLVVTAGIGLYLGYQAIPTLRHYGLLFFTQAQWQPELESDWHRRRAGGYGRGRPGRHGGQLPPGRAAWPCSSRTPDPSGSKSWLVSAVDLMAAVPSIIYGLWGSSSCSPTPSRWLAGSASTSGGSPSSRSTPTRTPPSGSSPRDTSSAFIAGLAVAMMTIPLATAVMRAVFDQAPLGEREAAMALGGTRFGVARKVVLPFGKGGIIGGTMLALGRALGETAAVLIIISPEYIIKPRILEAGTQTVSALIAGNFGNATKSQLTALLAAGFVLFVITLGVNSAAAVIIRRSRSGLATEA